MSDPDFSLLDLEQGSPEWIQARVGLVTASRCFDMANTTTKGKYTAAHESYRDELVCEILTGQPFPQHVTKEMEWGSAQEPFARAAYELREGVLVDTVGFVVHPSIDRFGCSPDGLVGEDGLIQIKCPTTRTHLNWIRGGVLPEEHMVQMIAELACTQRRWIDFVSYDPRLPEHLQLFVRRYERDANMVRLLEAEVERFNGEIDSILAALPQKPQGIAAVLEWPREGEMEF